MEMSETRLEEFEVTDVNTSPKKHFKTVVILSVIQNIMAICTFFIPFIPLLKTTTGMFANPIFVIQIIIFRTVPLFALGQLILKKKIGWSLTIIFSLIDILRRIPTHNIELEYEDLYNAMLPYFFASISMFIISVALVYLLLKETIRSLFGVSKKRLLLSILIAVILLTIMRFLVAPYLIKFAIKPVR